MAKMKKVSKKCGQIIAFLIKIDYISTCTGMGWASPKGGFGDSCSVGGAALFFLKFNANHIFLEMMRFFTYMVLF